MADLIDFLPLFQEDAVSVRTRMDQDANRGLTLGDPRWIDTREGSFYYDITQVCLLEIVRLWDTLSVEVPASAFPSFAWGEYLDSHAAVYGLERKAAVAAEGTVTFTGTTGTFLPTGTVVATDAPSEAADQVEFLTLAPATLALGTATVAVRASEEGVVGNVGVGAINELITPIANITAVSNAAPTQGGTEPEDDEGLRERILLEFSGSGGGNVNDYKRWALSRPGVGRVYVNPVWAGPGTVQVVVMTTTGDPVAAGVVTDVQNYLDPTAGTADGVAPPGITVTVQTPTPVAVNVAATVTFKPGYSLTGTGGTNEQSSVITAALSAYIDGLDVGDDVIYNHVLAQFFRAEGVLNVTALTVNGGSADVAINNTTPQIATLGTVTLS